ncbi:hypothetical protein AAG747_21050 [Rapidithrix thailandica]|uniref:Uncharacterized protein n=1 Tax=Rapidithrix thailandica TaxID=413964 RepID=A0AAW9S5G3_9BACT
MSHIVLEKWNELQLKIEQQRDELNRESLLIILFDWIRGIKKIKDSKVQNLYHEYLAYFEEVSDLDGILNIKPWYSLQELIEYDILKSTELSFERPIVKVRDVLWELLVFKSDKECPCCGDDNLRAMTYKGQKELFFCCDICGCIVDEDGGRKEVDDKLYPAPFELVELKKIGVSSIDN